MCIAVHQSIRSRPVSRLTCPRWRWPPTKGFLEVFLPEKPSNVMNVKRDSGFWKFIFPLQICRICDLDLSNCFVSVCSVFRTSTHDPLGPAIGEVIDKRTGEGTEPALDRTQRPRHDPNGVPHCSYSGH